MYKLFRASAPTIVSVALILGLSVAISASALANAKPKTFSNASFCGRYVSSYTGIYQPTAGGPPFATPLSALEAAVITADGKGNITDGELTQNAPPNAPQACAITGSETYTVGTSTLGESGYLTMNPAYTCTGYDSCPLGICTILTTPYGGGTIQWACYISDLDGDKVVCSELGNSFTDNSFSARAVTWERTSKDGCKRGW